MLILKGHLLHIFTQADYVNKETGEVIKYKGKENSDVEVEVATIGKCQFYGI
ncbi:hypothetical protein [Nitrosophilus alvini]|uniref:hypothetical protein n=1 Tax=Nitrosophilus alvini TaxID=2714855 RepID=UPI0019097BE6|nr:hypothetical protein [Nitrosophilus alvini]